MSIATYGELKTAIANWIHRGDLTSVIPDFVAMAESEIFVTHPSALRVRQMEAEATITIAANEGDLPSDFLEGRYLRFSGSPDKTYQYRPPEDWHRDKPGFFTVVGNKIRIPNDASGDCVLTYWAKPAVFSGSSDTNTILTGYPGVYLYASLKQAAIYTRDDNAGGQYDSLLNGLMTRANAKNQTAIGPLVVRAG